MSRIVISAAPAGTHSFKELLWQSVTIQKSLEDICHSVELILPVSQRDRVHKHDTLTVSYINKYLTDHNGRRPVTTVRVDEIKDSIDTEKTVTVLGRSPARDIIDSTWSQTIAGQADLLTITRSIAGKFNIAVDHIPTTENGTKPVANFAFENESPWTKLITEAENQGYIFTSSQTGNLYLTRQPRNAKQWGFYFNESKNIKSIERTETGAEQFHEYIVKGKNKEVTEIDWTCKNNRVFTINLPDFWVDEEKLRTRAKTEMKRRRENKIKVTVSGWGLTDEQIVRLGNTYQKEIFYEPNFLIPVKIPSEAIDTVLLTQSVMYTADNNKIETSIELINKEAYYG